MRPISKPHEKNYLQAKVLSGVRKEVKGELVIPPAHLYHSVGEVAEGEVIDLRDLPIIPNLIKLIKNIHSPVFLVSHNMGEGTFEFVKYPIY